MLQNDNCAVDCENMIENVFRLEQRQKPGGAKARVTSPGSPARTFNFGRQSLGKDLSLENLENPRSGSNWKSPSQVACTELMMTSRLIIYQSHIEWSALYKIITSSYAQSTGC